MAAAPPPLPVEPSSGAPETILVALDGSAFAESALGHVRPLARALGSRLHLVTVLDPTLSGGTAGRSAECRLQLVEAETYLERIARELREEGFRATVEVREGDPAHEIVAAALERGAELVAVTARPRRRDERLASRGIAQGVIAAGAMSLLVARGRREPGAVRREPGYDRIAVAVDGSAVSHRALRLAVVLAARHGAELVLVHVFPGDGRAAAGAARKRRRARGRRPDFDDVSAAGRYLRKIERSLPRPLSGVRTVLCQSRRVADTVEDAAREAGADLVVLGAHGAGRARARYGRCARDLLLHSEVPVLVVRDEGVPGDEGGIDAVALRKRRPRLHIGRRRNIEGADGSGVDQGSSERKVSR